MKSTTQRLIDLRLRVKSLEDQTLTLFLLVKGIRRDINKQQDKTKKQSNKK